MHQRKICPVYPEWTNDTHRQRGGVRVRMFTICRVGGYSTCVLPVNMSPPLAKLRLLQLSAASDAKVCIIDDSCAPGGSGGTGRRARLRIPRQSRSKPTHRYSTIYSIYRGQFLPAFTKPFLLMPAHRSVAVKLKPFVDRWQRPVKGFKP